MTRPILPTTQIHSAIQTKIAQLHIEMIQEVEQAIQAHDIVVLGMSGNPFVGKARKSLDALALAHHDIDYGNYFSMWRKRNVLKMWTGWPTFPMVFARGMLIGGAQELEQCIASGELQRLLAP